MVITTLKLVSLQEVVRGEVTRQARVSAAFDTCCGARPWKLVLGMLLERNWRGTGRESRALYTLGDQGHAGARCNIGVFFFAQDMNETVQILMFAVAQGLFGLVPVWAGAISEVTVHVRRRAGQRSSSTHSAQFYMRGDSVTQQMEAVRFSL